MESARFPIFSTSEWFSFWHRFFDAFLTLIFHGLDAKMGLKSLHFESPGRRNFNVFAQLNFIYARSVKIAPLPYENLIFAYSRLPKMSKKSYKNPSKRPSKSISSCKGSWNPKNHDFHVKNIDFRVAKNSGFFSKSGRGGDDVRCSSCFCCNAVFFGFLGALGRFLDPIWT